LSKIHAIIFLFKNSKDAKIFYAVKSINQLIINQWNKEFINNKSLR